MEFVRRLEPVALFLLIVAALNWAIIALFDTNMVTEVFGTGTSPTSSTSSSASAACCWCRG